VPDLTIRIRKACVAGTFYPGTTAALRAELDRCHAQRRVRDDPAPKAVIAPHAGYIYSGPVAATAYAAVARACGTVHRVVLVGPSHRYRLSGFAVPESQIWQTPLGPVALDGDALEPVAQRRDVARSDLAHEREHSLEVHLPFLQRALGRFSLVPILVGGASADSVAGLLQTLWGGPETLVVVSTDLSHFHPQAVAQAKDAATVAAITALDDSTLDGDAACGATPVAGLLRVARGAGMTCHAVDVRTSADTAGEPDRVVGYASFLLYAP